MLQKMYFFNNTDANTIIVKDTSIKELLDSNPMVRRNVVVKQ